MSQALARLHAENPKKRNRSAILELQSKKTYDDGRTKQSHKDECNIEKIMARFNVTGTISHLAKHEGSYADFSDFDFHEQIGKLTKGREIFDELPAELRKEFGQSPAAFFAYVNDPKNAEDLRTKLPALAQPGQQLPRKVSPDADLEAADAAANEAKPNEKPLEPSEKKEETSDTTSKAE